MRSTNSFDSLSSSMAVMSTKFRDRATHWEIATFHFLLQTAKDTGHVVHTTDHGNSSSLHSKS